MQTAREKKEKEWRQHCGANRVVITHPNQSPNSRRQFCHQRLQSLAKVKKENINVCRDFLGGGEATQSPRCRLHLVRGGSDGCVWWSESESIWIQNAQNTRSAFINQTRRRLLSTHTWKKANLLLLMLVEASRSIKSLATTSLVNLLANQWRFGQDEASSCDLQKLFQRRHNVGDKGQRETLTLWSGGISGKSCDWYCSDFGTFRGGTKFDLHNLALMACNFALCICSLRLPGCKSEW